MKHEAFGSRAGGVLPNTGVRRNCVGCKRGAGRIAWVTGAFLAIALTGCSSVKTTYLADGRRGYMVACHGPFKRWSDCVARAGRLCKAQGYSVRYEDEFSRELVIACSGNHDVLTGDLREP